MHQVKMAIVKPSLKSSVIVFYIQKELAKSLGWPVGEKVALDQNGGVWSIKKNCEGYAIIHASGHIHA